MWLAPSEEPAAATAAHKPLRLDQARLLRRVQRDADTRAKLGKTERELVLPHLLRRELISDTRGVLHLTDAVTLSLTVAEDDAAASPQQTTVRSIENDTARHGI